MSAWGRERLCAGWAPLLSRELLACSCPPEPPPAPPPEGALALSPRGERGSLSQDSPSGTQTAGRHSRGLVRLLPTPPLSRRQKD